MKFIRFRSGEYYTEDNSFMIKKNCFDTWDVYQAYAPFKGEYSFTCRTLKEAKKNVLSKYKEETK